MYLLSGEGSRFDSGFLHNTTASLPEVRPFVQGRNVFFSKAADPCDIAKIGLLCTQLAFLATTEAHCLARVYLLLILSLCCSLSSQSTDLPDQEIARHRAEAAVVCSGTKEAAETSSYQYSGNTPFWKAGRYIHR
jgi:hypothetical protein